MNNAKMWLVVKPTVGVPLFLGAVAVGSFAVHVAVLSSTSWVGDFLSGAEMGSSQTAALESNVKAASLETDSAQVYSITPANGEAEKMVVVLPDGRMAKAVFEAPVAMAPPLSD